MNRVTKCLEYLVPHRAKQLVLLKLDPRHAECSHLHMFLVKVLWLQRSHKYYQEPVALTL